ncbi:MAG: hypothetical protein LBQ66_12965 [Planctomycetaceae bacterium]|jgi:hypothetical protein|nr:hypothetical protein [Planctomycetaceae bacterium]
MRTDYICCYYRGVRRGRQACCLPAFLPNAGYFLCQVLEQVYFKLAVSLIILSKKQRGQLQNFIPDEIIPKKIGLL